MCGRFGSTLTVWASPIWDVSAISTGASTPREMSMISSPPRGASMSPTDALVMATPGRIRRVDQKLGVFLDGVRILGVERNAAALGRRLDVVLKARRSGRVGKAACRRMACHERGCDLTAVGELDDRLPAGVRADPERADRGVRLAVLREEVQIGMGIAGRDAADQIPRRVLPARLRCERRRRRRLERRVRMVELEPVSRQRR